MLNDCTWRDGKIFRVRTPTDRPTAILVVVASDSAGSYSVTKYQVTCADRLTNTPPAAMCVESHARETHAESHARHNPCE
eukprot:8032346-Pyramimonas_sp.AAC.1